MAAVTGSTSLHQEMEPFTNLAAKKVVDANKSSHKYALEGRVVRGSIPFNKAFSWMPGALVYLNKDIGEMTEHLRNRSVSPKDHKPFRRLYENYQGLVRYYSEAVSLQKTYGPFLNDPTRLDRSNQHAQALTALQTLEYGCRGFSEKLDEARESLSKLGARVLNGFNRIAFLDLHWRKIKYVSDKGFNSAFLVDYIKGIQSALLQSADLQDLVRRVEMCRKFLPGGNIDEAEPAVKGTGQHQTVTSNPPEEISLEQAIERLLHLKQDCMYRFMLLEKGYDSPLLLSNVEAATRWQSELDVLQEHAGGKGELPDQLIQDISEDLDRIKEKICEMDQDATSTRPSWQESVLFSFDISRSGLYSVFSPIFHALSCDDITYAGNFPSIVTCLNKFLRNMRDLLARKESVNIKSSLKTGRKPMASAAATSAPVATSAPAVTFDNLTEKWTEQVTTIQGGQEVEIPLNTALAPAKDRIAELIEKVSTKILGMEAQPQSSRKNWENVRDVRGYMQHANVLKNLFAQVRACKQLFDANLSQFAPNSDDKARKQVLADLRASGVSVKMDVLKEKDEKYSLFERHQKEVSDFTGKFANSLEELNEKITRLERLIVPIEGGGRSILFDPDIDPSKLFETISAAQQCLWYADTLDQLAETCWNTAQEFSAIASKLNPRRYSKIDFLEIEPSKVEVKEGTQEIEQLEVEEGSEDDQIESLAVADGSGKEKPSEVAKGSGKEKPLAATEGSDSEQSSSDGDEA